MPTRPNDTNETDPMTYDLYCHECSWSSTSVELKGEANWIAGKHISKTGHSVAMKEIDEEPPEPPKDADFFRSSRDGEGATEILRVVADHAPKVEDEPDELRRCGPVVCRVQAIQ